MCDWMNLLVYVCTQMYLMYLCVYVMDVLVYVGIWMYMEASQLHVLFLRSCLPCYF